MMHINRINSLQNDNILGWTKLKAFANDKLNIAEMIISLLGRIENIVGKGENVIASIFSFSNNVSERHLPQGR